MFDSYTPTYLKIKVMTVKVRKDFRLAVKRALTGETNGRDMISIVKFQNRNMGEIHDVEAATLVILQVAFN
jgi:hypothetical protein